MTPTPTPKGSCCEKCAELASPHLKPSEGGLDLKCGNPSCDCHSPKVSQKIEEKIRYFDNNCIVPKNWNSQEYDSIDIINSDTRDFLRAALTDIYEQGKNDGREEEAIDCHEHCEIARKEGWNSALEEAGKVEVIMDTKFIDDSHYREGFADAKDQSRTSINNLLIK